MSQGLTEKELKLEVSNLRKEVLALRQSEKASKIELAELNQIFQTVADGVIVIEKDFNVIRVNETFTVLSGFSEQEIMGRKCYEIFPGTLCHTPGCPMVRISCCAERIEYEVEKQRRNRTKIPCIVTATPLRGSDGKLLGIVENFKDVSRLKRIGDYYHKNDDKLNIPLASKTIYNLVENIIKKKREVDDSKQIQEQVEQYNLPSEYQQALEKFEVRGVTAKPKVQKAPLLQLLLRGFFGVNARAEVLLYLFYIKEGSSNQIARAVQFDQKIVYRILEKWTDTGFVDKEPSRKYILSNPDLFSILLKNADDSVKYLDWINTFHVLARIMRALNTGPWESDAYLLSSFFRHISKDMKRVARFVDVSFSESNLFKGEEYLSPFIKDIMNILKNL